jgi:GAF domain-containing protein/HAMP domain-containing protein
MMMLTTATMLIWYFIVAPTIAATPNDLWAQAAAAAYPIGDLVVLGSILVLLHRCTERDTQAALLFFLVGMILFVGADIVFAYSTLNGTYEEGGWLDTVWVVAQTFFIWAALRQCYVSPASSPEPGWARLGLRLIKLLPLVSLGLGYALVLYVALLDIRSTATAWLFGGAVLLTILFVGQQFAVAGITQLSLRSKLILAFVGVTVLAIGGMALVVNQVLRVGLTDQVGQNLHALAEVKAQQIGDLLGEQVETLNAFTLSPGLRDEIEATQSHPAGDAGVIREQLHRADLQWDVLSDDDPLVLKVLDNNISHDLREFQKRFPGFIELLVTNQYGELVGASQRTRNYDYFDKSWWQTTYNLGRGGVYLGQPEFNNQVSAFGVIIAVPVYSRLDNQRVIGVIRSTYSLAALTEGLAAVRFGQTGSAALLLPSGQMLSAEGSLEALEPEILAELNSLAVLSYAQLSPQGTPRLLSQALVTQSEVRAETEPVKQLNWQLVVDQAADEALAPVHQVTRIAVLVSLGALVLAALLGLVVAQLLASPISRLTAVAARISEGDLNIQAVAESSDEIGVLATTFNTMTARLRQTLQGLKDRSQRLETIASLSERLSALLTLDELLAEVVTQIKDKFGYDHAHLYLLHEAAPRAEADQASSQGAGVLVMAASTGGAGVELQARKHTIPLGAPAGLVARAARLGEVIQVDNVPAAADWLPNPLLPDTYSEIAVPIMLEGKVLGVLNVQQDKIAGLDESDAHLLRTLANQVAVGMRNANQFAQVQTALTEARLMQARYLEQAWDKRKFVNRAPEYLYSQPGSPALSKATVERGHMQALTQPQAALGPVDEIESLVAPVKLNGQVIGVLQLYNLNVPHQHQGWDQDDLAVVEAVLDQVAQTAENLRLFDETRERAGYEHTIREITDKLRAAPTLDRLLETAARELGQQLGVHHTVLELGIEPDQNGHG